MRQDCKNCPYKESNYDDYMLKLRQKIRVTLLIKALEDHVIKNTEMSSTQVNAALALLKKALPDIALPKIEIAGKQDINISHEDALKELE